jgi:hypothetical protein
VTAPFAGQRRVPDQAERRIDLKLKDQYGRECHMNWDKLAGGMVAQPFLRFKAPWTPHIKYFKCEFKNDSPMPTGWHFDLQQCNDDNRESWEVYFTRLHRVAGKMPGIDSVSAYESARTGDWENVPRSLLEEVGARPEPMDLIRASMAGNRWVLGLSNVVPPWAYGWVEEQTRRREEEAAGVTGAELQKYRDEAPDVAMDAALDDEYEAKGLGAGIEPVKPRKPGPKTPITA